MPELEGKVALVTGATRSIGEAIAGALHAAGARVLVTGIDDADGERVAAVLGEGAAYRQLDVEKDEDIDRALNDVRALFGRLDIIVNCACSYLDFGLATSRADWLKSLNVNLVGPAILVQKAVPHLTQPGGVIVNIGSSAGKFGSGWRFTYAAGKAALMHFTRLAAVALGPQGIRVVTVSPAWTWSPAMQAMAKTRDDADRAGAELHPLGRVGRAHEVADVVVFACSEKAAWMTGCDLAVDGGYSALGPDQGRGAQFWCDRAQSDAGGGKPSS